MIRIRKYPNRRLYNTAESRYVNLADLRELVVCHQDFIVEDARTGEDLTKAILLQIITELEGSPEESLLTETVLRQLICFYGAGEHRWFRLFLEQALRMFRENRSLLPSLEELRHLDRLKDPLGFWREWLGR